MIDAAIDPAFAAAGVAANLGLLEAEVGVVPAEAALVAALAAEAARLTEDAEMPLPPPVVEARAAFKDLGKDPSRYRSATEALIRRLRAGKPPPAVNNVVDAANLTALRTGFSIGVYDRDRLRPPLALRVGRAGETYASLAKGDLNLEGLPTLFDAEGPFGGPVSDGRRTAVTEVMRRVLLVVYAFGSTRVDSAALKLAKAMFERHAAAAAVGETALVGTDRPPDT